MKGIKYYLTTNQLYKIAQKLYDDRNNFEVDQMSKLYFRPQAVLEIILNSGYVEMGNYNHRTFEDDFDNDTRLELVAVEGRIYAFYHQAGEEVGRSTGDFPISDGVLKRFKLTEEGNEFVKKYL